MQSGGSWPLVSPTWQELYDDSWEVVTPTAAQLQVGKLFIDKYADKLSHRETETVYGDVNEIHAALCYVKSQICGEAHIAQGCDCSCCESYWCEAFSLCQSCRKLEIIRDRILEAKGEGLPAVILTKEELDRVFPQQSRPAAKSAAKPAAKPAAKAKRSHFNFSFA